MHDSGELRGATVSARLTLALPVRPGQSESYRRFLQELKASRRMEFEAACQRWGIYSMAIWLVPARPSGPAVDLIVAQLELAADLAQARERFSHSQLPFDSWIKERVRELLAVDLNSGVARYRAELLEVWQNLGSLA